MSELIAILLLASHLLAVNLASCGPLVAAWLDLREGRGDLTAGIAGRRLTLWSLVALVVGILGGLAVGYLWWDDGYRIALRRLSSRIYFGGAELAFSLFLQILQLVCWRRRWGDSRRGRWGRGCLAFLSATNLLYHFPILLVIFSRIVSGEDAGDLPLTSAEFRARIVNATVLARSLHFWLASIAVSGVGLMLVARVLGRWNSPSAGSITADSNAADPNTMSARDSDHALSHDDARRLAAYGARIALVPSLLQVLSGAWLLIQLDPFTQSQLLGGDAVSSLSFAAGVGLAMWLLHRLASASWGEVDRRSILITAGALVATVVFMTATLRQIERAARSARPAPESSRFVPPGLTQYERAPV